MDNTISMAEPDALLDITHGTSSTRAVPPLRPSIDVDELGLMSAAHCKPSSAC
jgi:hypothetical protein